MEQIYYSFLSFSISALQRVPRIHIVAKSEEIMTKVVSLGGSIVAPEGIDTGFIKKLRDLLFGFLSDFEDSRLILVVGGGGPARAYQGAYREIMTDPDSRQQDWIGIAATHLNGELIKAVMAPHCKDPLVKDPTSSFTFTGRILIAAGWKPGFSTDYDAVVLAERFSADTVINLSNIKQVYSADPKKDPAAVPLDTVRWSEFQKIVGTEWTPGINLPFDPVATKKAAELALKVVVAEGRDLENLSRILRDLDFTGTSIY
jgi:uridylate kinase